MQVVPCDRAWAIALEQQRHYLRRAVNNRACPLSYELFLDGKVCGLMTFGLPHFVKQRGLFGYPGLPTQWQVLILFRLWLHPHFQGLWSMQRGGRLMPVNLPSCALGQLLRQAGGTCRLQQDWLAHRPPKDPSQPFEIRLVIAYANPSVGHEGTSYRAAGFESRGMTQTRKAAPSSRGGHDGQQKYVFVYWLN